MNTYMNRWTVSLGWTVGMLIVWSLFVPRPVSVTTFFLLGATGLMVSLFGSMSPGDKQPQSVAAIIGEPEAQQGSTDGSKVAGNR